jgi:hypothetical protein
MTMPTVIVDVGFTAGASTGTYLHLGDTARGLLGTGTLAPTDVMTEVTAYVLRATLRRGSTRVESPIVRYEAGTSTTTMLNTDRRFDPTNLGSNVGLVVGDPAAPTAGDAALLDHIADRGYRATYIDDAAAATTSYDVFVIAESVTAATVGTAYDTVAVPVVVCERELWDDMRLAANTGASTAAASTYDLEAHTITTGLADPLTILASDQAQRGVLATALVGVSATVFARPSADTSRAAGWAIESGGNLTSGTAPARRVALFVADAWPTLFTADGWALFDAAVDWAIGSTAISAPYVSAGATQVTPMRVVRHRATWAGTTYPLWRGYADAWDLNYEGPYAEAVLTATDGFKVLANYDRTAGGSVGAGEDSGARVGRILTSAGWNTTDRVVAAGDTTVQATTLDGTALTELYLVADTEIGELYIDGAGRLVFRNRHAIMEDARSNTAQGVFGNAGGSELPYGDVTVQYDDQTLINLVRVARAGGSQQTAQDATSQTRYLVHTFDRTDLLMETDTVALDYAQWVLYQSKDPELRFATITVHPRLDPDVLFPQVLGREIGDRITIRLTPPGGGARIERDVFIRGIEHEIGPMTWRTTWTLQSATKYDFLLLGSATLGVLGEQALAY